MIQGLVRLRAPAKLNLDLRVRGRLPDGRHEIESVIQAIDLCDVLELEKGSGLQLEGDFKVPTDEGNLALQAAALAEANVRIRLVKRIPPGSGMGGGSSDAAAILRQFGAGAEAARKLGADVEFFLRGGRQVARGAGDRLEPLPDTAAWFAIAWPGFTVSTAAVYAMWDEMGGQGRNHLFKAACAVAPRLKDFAEALGAGWTMTGSGSAFFYEAASDAEARRAEAGLAALGCWSAVASSLPAFD